MYYAIRTVVVRKSQNKCDGSIKKTKTVDKFNINIIRTYRNSESYRLVFSYDFWSFDVGTFYR